MDQKRIIDEFKELVSIEVHSRDERAIADVLKEKLTALGLTVTEDKAGEVLGGNTGNVYARLSGNADGEPVLFSAHMDRVGNHGHIVPSVQEAEGKIVSDGTSILAGDDIGGHADPCDASRSEGEADPAWADRSGLLCVRGNGRRRFASV